MLDYKRFILLIGSFLLLSNLGTSQTYLDTVYYEHDTSQIYRIMELSTETKEPAGQWLEYHPSGPLKLRCAKVGEGFQGEYQMLYENGQLQKHFSYEKEKIHGSYQVYYQDGSKKLMANYRAGNVDGKWIS